MSASSATLTSLWVDEKGSPTKSVTIGTPSKGQQDDDFGKYYQEVGLELLAKQTGVLSAKESKVAGSKAIHCGADVKSSVPGGHTYYYVGSPTKQILPKATVTPVVTHISNSSTPVSTQRLNIYSTTSNNNSFLSSESRKRAIESPTFYSIEDSMDSKRQRKGEKGSKGLRHFSMKVCEKVQKKGITTYNEVADELVNEFSDPSNTLTEQAHYDQKNIRRRVYDALNVLMAMNIISKEKKEIRWIGLPTNSAQECQSLEVEKGKLLERIEHKTQQLHELVLQQVAYKNLVQRNKDLEQKYGAPAENSSIQLPFVIVNTDKKTVIDCNISNDKYEYLFNFDNTFEIHDDIEVLKRMGLAFGLEKGDCSSENLQKAIDVLPKSLERYVRDIAANGKLSVSNAGNDLMSSSALQHSVSSDVSYQYD